MKNWKIYQLGGILLISFLCVNSVFSFFNKTLVDVPESYANVTNGKSLWLSLMHNCKKPTTTCVTNTVYNYLNNLFDHTNNYKFNEYVNIIKNNVSYGLETKNDNFSFNARSGPLDQVTAALQNKALKFFMTHDIQLQMPEIIFQGTKLQVSPRQLDEGGLLTQFQLLPRGAKDASQPRIFFKKIKRFIGEKLMNALLVVMLVLSLLAIKFMFLLPLFMGVAAAKKLVLKLVLFLFPFLTHIFKLCPYVEPPSLTKLHHHHHQVAHLHHVGPHAHYHETKHPVIYEGKYPPTFHEGKYPPTFHEGPPHQHHFDHATVPEIGLEFYSDGPEIANELITHHRKTDPTATSIVADENQVHSWGKLGQGQDKSRLKSHQLNRPLTPAEIENLALIAEKEAVLKVRLQQEHQRVLAENKLLQEQIKQSLKMQEKLKMQALGMHHKRQIEPIYQGGAVTTPISITTPLQIKNIGAMHTLHTNEISQNPSLAPQQMYSRKETFSQLIKNPEVTSYDAFYSPILDKIDGILSLIGIKEEACKERIICSMYKNPSKFSPHSNFLSTQLSRDSSELQKPSATNSAVIRFYRYVQAARDGQDKRECLRLYPACSINTEL